MLASEISRSFQLAGGVCANSSGCLADFQQTLLESPDTDVETFLRSRPTEDRSELPALIAIELCQRISTGRPCRRVEQYLEQFPELNNDRERVLDLIYAEYRARLVRQPTVEPQEYYERFPRLQESLERLFRIDRMFESNATVGYRVGDELAGLPEQGDTFLDFRLRIELGHGAFGRVFLADQTNLSDRRVVVKITPCDSVEHRTLARLDHPNIVPILSVHRDDLTGLQAVCMPYQNAVALSDVQATWQDKLRIPTRADALLRGVSALVPINVISTELSNVQFPQHRNFIYACAWIMHKLADVLVHAHAQGIHHRDIKPSNVLLTISGEPLLVDFNLAFDRLESEDSPSNSFGGTLAYMPPEHMEVFHPIAQGRPEDVGARSDLYSLAATMFELLTGRLPFHPPEPGSDRLTALCLQLEQRYNAVPSARELNPQVPADLDSLLVKCLDPTPQRRYESAEQLADDLGRFLRDRPLGHVPAALHVRLRKFTRRNRRRLAIGSTIAATLCGVLVVMHYAHDQAARERRSREQAEVIAAALETSGEQQADEALALLPKDAMKYFMAGVGFLESRQFAAGNRCFTRAMELRPNFSRAYAFRGRCFANLDRDVEALRDYTTAIECDPNDYFPFLTRAICYASSEQQASPERALADVERMQELMPKAIDESTKLYYLEIARIYSAASAKFPAGEERERALKLGEVNLVKSLELGLDLTYLNERKVSDRFHMLDSLLDRTSVKGLLEQHAQKKEATSQTYRSY